MAYNNNIKVAPYGTFLTSSHLYFPDRFLLHKNRVLAKTELDHFLTRRVTLWKSENVHEVSCHASDTKTCALLWFCRR